MASFVAAVDLSADTLYLLPVAVAVVVTYAATRYALDALNERCAQQHACRPLSPVHALPAMALLVWLTVGICFGDARAALHGLIAGALLILYVAGMALRIGRQTSGRVALAAAGLILLGGVVFPVAFLVALGNGELGEFFRGGKEPEKKTPTQSDSLERAEAPALATSLPPSVPRAAPAAAGGMPLIAVFIFGGLGVLALAGGIATAVHTLRVGAGAVQTEGEVIRLVGGGRGGARPVVRYVVGGAAHEIEGHSGSSPPAYAVGDLVSVLYQPDDPGAGQIDSFFERWFISLFLSGFGLIFIAVGCGTQVSRVRARRRRQVALTARRSDSTPAAG